jgi:hypothetical protein
MATPRIIDDGGTGYSNAGGGWAQAVGQGYGATVDYAGPTGNGSNTALWTATGLTAGATVAVAYTWTGNATAPNRATNTPWRILDADGTTVLASGTLNQENEPSANHVEGGFNFQHIGKVTTTGTSVSFEISDNANEYVIADAARFLVTVTRLSVMATPGRHYNIVAKAAAGGGFTDFRTTPFAAGHMTLTGGLA